MRELLIAIENLEESQDNQWSEEAFQQILSIARVAPTEIDILENIDQQTTRIFGNSGVKLLVELKKCLESSNNLEIVWNSVGILLNWALDLHRKGKEMLKLEFSRRAREDRGLDRHSEILEGGNDLLFGTQLDFCLNTIATLVNHGILPQHMDTFFTRGLSILDNNNKKKSSSAAVGVPPLRSSAVGLHQRLFSIIESCLEKFLIKLFSSKSSTIRWLGNDLSRSIIAKASKISVPCILRAILNRLLSKAGGNNIGERDGGPTIADECRLVTFILGTLDFINPGQVEDEVAQDLVLGEYHLLNFVCEKVGGEEEDLVLFSRVLVTISRKWSDVLATSSSSKKNKFPGRIFNGIEKYLNVNFQKGLPLESLVYNSISQGIMACNSLFPDDQTTFRISLLLALQTPKEQFSISLGLRPYITFGRDVIRLIVLSFGYPHLEENLLIAIQKTFSKFVEENVKETCWIAGEFAVEINSVLEMLGMWKYNFMLASKRIHDLLDDGYSENVLQQLEDLEYLFVSLHGLEDNGSIRHLQDAASFFVHFGKPKTFSIAIQKFLNDLSKALFDSRRYWECGNARIMLAACHLARKEYELSSECFRLATESFSFCGAFIEIDSILSSCDVFSRNSSTAGRYWDWCLLSQASATNKAAVAKYFLVGAVGVGDPDLTIIRVISLRNAFDEAVELLEYNSLRRLVRGELKWTKMDVETYSPSFYPAEVVNTEYGFWIQQVFPLIGEESEDHCPRQFGIIGVGDLVLQTVRRGLTPLIPAASVISRKQDQNRLDVPFGWREDNDEIVVPIPPSFPPPNYPPPNQNDSFFTPEDIPPPPGPPPPLKATTTLNENRSKRVFIEEDSPPPPPPPPPLPPSSAAVETEAQKRKKEFLRQKREKEMQAAQQKQFENEALEAKEAEKERRNQERLLFKQQQQMEEEQEEEDRRKQEQLLVQRKKQQQQKVENEEIRRRQLLAEQAREASQRKLEIEQEEEEQEEEIMNTTQNTSQDNLLLLKRRQQQQSPPQRRVMLVNDEDDDNVIQTKPTKKITLLDRPVSTKPRKIQIQDDEEVIPPKKSSSKTNGSQRFVPQQEEEQEEEQQQQQEEEEIEEQYEPEQQEEEEEEVSPPKDRPEITVEEKRLPPHSASRAFFNVGGARVTVEEAALVNKFLSCGEGWISAKLLQQKNQPVSLKFSSSNGIQIFAEPHLDLLNSIPLTNDVTVDVSVSDGSIVELFYPERKSKGLGPILLSCEHPQLLRAVVGAFRGVS